MAKISMRGVAKSFGGLKVIHDVDVEVADGEFVVLVGPSGCGKSTLLRMIAGLETISDGDIVIGGRLVNDLAPKDRDVAMVFQSYALYPHKTVGENIGFPLRMAGRPRREAEAKVAAAADVLGLAPLLDRFPKELSGGQRQRVAMGRAIVRDPQVFLFDEPLSNLDAKLRVTMRAEIKQLHHRLGATIVYVTHDQIEAMTLADRIVVMHDGRVEQVGAPLDLYDAPANAFVAGFIGSPAMNLIPGRVAEGPDGPVVLPDAGGPALPMPRARAEPGRPVTWGIRPEHLAIGREAEGGGLLVEVAVIEPTGAETQVLARAGGVTLDAVVRERVRAEPGTALRLRVDPALVHLFDGATGLRI